ncbi:MAG: type IV toxin-antitoxin system AbiEi family antitoxin [Pseudobdellovibrionaceae bacterium]
MDAQLAGIGKKQRSQLAVLLKARTAVITPNTAAKALKIAQNQAAQLLALWAKKGWLSRVKHGVYIPISIQAESPEIMADEPWAIANAILSPCYIGGWSAAEHWDFTEQIFNSTMVFTTKKTASRELNLKGAKLTTKTIKAERIFGTQNIWRDNQKIPISDPTRTIVDAFNDPAVVGGIRMAVDMLARYLKSEHKNLDLLFQYATQMKNTATFKRLGFILERQHSSENIFIQKIKNKIKSGYSQLDPSTPGKSLVTTWNLWVPTSWKKGSALND